jgi:heme-degrading monooxygenase HmoA
MHTIPDDVTNAYAVIFSYILSDNLEGYSEMDLLTIDEVTKIDGYLGYEKFGNGKQNTFISYWKNLDSIEEWKKNLLHIEAKKNGPKWYQNFRVQIVQVLKDSNYFEK